MYRALFLLPVLFAVAGTSAQSGVGSGERADARPVPDSSRQLVLVVTDDWGATDGVLRRFSRASGDEAWEPVGDGHAVVVGRSGLGWGIGLHEPQADGPQKQEGDGRAPAGVFRLVATFGYADSVATGLPYVTADANLECVDDAASPYYNRVLDRSRVDDAAWTSHEEMRRDDVLYKIGVIVAHNGGAVGSTGPEVVPSGGSCIFLHVWRGPGSTTAGCTAMPEQSLATMMEWLDEASHPVFVQLPRVEYDRLLDAWGLPAHLDPTPRRP